MSEPNWKAQAAQWEAMYMRLLADYHRLEGQARSMRELLAIIPPKGLTDLLDRVGAGAEDP